MNERERERGREGEREREREAGGVGWGREVAREEDRVNGKEIAGQSAPPRVPLVFIMLGVN